MTRLTVQFSTGVASEGATVITNIAEIRTKTICYI